jgi:Domain of unknown function (DUF6898)
LGRAKGRGSAMTDRGREVILEFHHVGNSVKVTAIDPETLIEVSIVGSPAAGEEVLKQTALRKLDYVLAKRAKEM